MVTLPDLHRPAWVEDSLLMALELLHELRHVGDLLEQLVSLEEERRAGERQMEELGAMLAGGDSQSGELTDQEAEIDSPSRVFTVQEAENNSRSRVFTEIHSPSRVFTDQHLVDAHFRERDGSYWISVGGEGDRPRPATPEEMQRLAQLVGRRKRA